MAEVTAGRELGLEPPPRVIRVHILWTTNLSHASLLIPHLCTIQCSKNLNIFVSRQQSFGTGCCNHLQGSPKRLSCQVQVVFLKWLGLWNLLLLEYPDDQDNRSVKVGVISHKNDNLHQHLPLEPQTSRRCKCAVDKVNEKEAYWDYLTDRLHYTYCKHTILQRFLGRILSIPQNSSKMFHIKISYAL